MTGKTARLIFWLGTLSSAAIFLWMTYDFHRQTPNYTQVDQLSDEVVAGKKVWHKYNCNDCHTILGFGGYYAPDMTKAFYRLGENNIASIVMHPEEVYKNSFRKMPHLGVSEAEAKQLVAFLQVGRHHRQPPLAAPGREVRQGLQTAGGPRPAAEQGRYRPGRLRRLPQLREPGAQRRRRLQRHRQTDRL